MRSRDVHRAASRSPSRGRRRQSPMLRDSAGRRDVSNRADSRGRYRERRDDCRERNKRRISAEKQLHIDRTPDRPELAPYPKRSVRHPRYPDTHGAVCRSADRRGSDHSECLRPSLSGSRERRAASSGRRSPPRDRNSKWSRSGTRSESGSRRGGAVNASRPSSDIECRSRRRTDNGSRESKGGNLNRCSLNPEASPLRRSSLGSRRRTPSRSSPNRDRGTCQRSSGQPRQWVNETPRRHSPYQDRSPPSGHSVSTGRMAVEESKRSEHPEQQSPPGFLSRSADCPTPDLASSRSWKADSEGADLSGHSLSRGLQQISAEEAPRARVVAKDSEEKTASRRVGRSKARHNASLSRSPSHRPGDAEVEPDEAKELVLSQPTTPRAQEQAAAGKEHRHSTKVGEPSSVQELHGQEGSIQEDAASQHQDETSPKGGEQAEKADSKANRSSSLRRLHSRRQSEGSVHGCDGHSSGAASPEITTAVEAMDSRRLDEPVNAYVAATSNEDIAPCREADVARGKRKIVATEQGAPSAGTAEMCAPRESPPRRYFRVQRMLPEPGDRVLSSINRFHLSNSNRWDRFERAERFDFLRPPHPGNTARSVRLVGGYNDGTSYAQLQHRGRNITPNEWQRTHLHNGGFQRAGQPNPQYLHRASGPVPPVGGRNRKMAGIFGRGPSERRHPAAASNADGKWGHDLFEQLSNEPERKRRRFNLYGQTLERVDD